MKTKGIVTEKMLEKFEAMNKAEREEYLADLTARVEKANEKAEALKNKEAKLNLKRGNDLANMTWQTYMGGLAGTLVGVANGSDASLNEALNTTLREGTFIGAGCGLVAGVLAGALVANVNNLANKKKPVSKAIVRLQEQLNEKKLDKLTTEIDACSMVNDGEMEM